MVLSSLSFGRRAILILWALVIFALLWLTPIAESKARATLRNDTVAVRSWQSSAAFPSPTVQAFAQTSDGALWIGTRNGLVRFDGSTFSSYSHENTPALTEENVQCLFVSIDGRLWIGTAGTNGGGLVVYENGVFTKVVENPGIDVSYVRQIIQDRSGQIWVVADRAFCRLNHGRLESVSILFGPGERPHAPMLIDRQGRLWVTTEHRLYQLKDSHAVRFQLSGNPLKDRSHALLATDDGSVLLGSDGGLWRLYAGTSRFVRVRGAPRYIYSLAHTPNSDVWIGTADRGLYILHKSTATISPFPTRSSTFSRTVFALFTDRDGDVWAGTYTGFFRLQHNVVRLLEVPGAGDSDLASVSSDEDGSLWWSSVHLFHAYGTRIEAVRVPRDRDVRIRTVVRGPDKTLWIGTEGNGVYALTLTGRRHYTTANGLSTDFVRAITISRTGEIWIGGDSDGLTQISKTHIKRYGLSAGLVYPTIRCLLEDSDKTLWVGTEHGLSKFRSGGFVHDSVTTELRNEKIWSLLQDRDGDIWIGTRDGGLFRVHGDKIFHFTYLNSLVDNKVFSVLQDDQDHLWIGGPDSVSVFNRRELSALANGSDLRPYRQDVFLSELAFPLQLNGGTQYSGVITGNLAWFSANKGLVQMNLDDQPSPRLTTIDFSECKADDHQVPCGETLTVAPGTQRVEVDVNPVLLRGQFSVNVRYRLAGHDRQWNTLAPRQHSILYSNVPAGVYQLEVTAWHGANPEGVVSRTLNVKIRRSAWQSPWIVPSSLVAISLLGLLVHRLHLRRTEARFRVVLAERERLAREMHDTLIQGCVGVTSLLRTATSEEISDEETRNHFIEYAATQLHLTVSEARKAVWNLRNEQTGKVDLRTALLGLVKKFKDNHAVSISTSISGQQFSVLPQAAHDILMITRESLFNATQHGAASAVQIYLRYEGSLLAMTISDNGAGFDTLSEAPEGHFGIVGMRERMLHWDGNLELYSTPGEGTTVQLVCRKIRVTPKKSQ